MLYTITNSGSTNSRPTQIGANTVATTYGTSYVFTLADFTTETTPAYSDPEGDALSYIKVLTLPSQGELHVDDVAISAGALITVGTISTGNLSLFLQQLNHSQRLSLHLLLIVQMQDLIHLVDLIQE